MSQTEHKRQIIDALSKHHTRVACTIWECLSVAMDLIDVQPPTVLEALSDSLKEQRRTLPNDLRDDLRQCLIKYCETVLQEARVRERHFGA